MMPWAAITNIGPAIASGTVAYLLPESTLPLEEPLVEKIEEAGGFYFRSILLKTAGTLVPQHVHDHDHVTLVCNGSARGWADKAYIGERSAGEVFVIKAGAEHVFMALEENTRLACVHNIESAESVKAKEI